MSQMIKQIGVVVVGLGIAGRVRIRDVKEWTTGLILRGAVSRRPVEIEDVTPLSIDDALSCPDVDALIISTENALHEEFIQKGLNHKKHILVEYPLALSASRAKELFQLAAEKGLVLWEEDIALLTESHLAVKSKLASVGITSVNYTVSGSFNGWQENFDQSGLPFISGISSIETLVDLFGNLNVLSASLTKDENSFSATANLETQNHRPITVTLSRTSDKELKRSKVVVYEFEDGEVIDTSKFISSKPLHKQGLFMQDLQGFYQAVINGTTPDSRRDLTICSMEIAEKIHSLL